MGVVRQVVFPALRLVVWSVIAIALCVIAFRGGADATAGPSDGPLEPTADLSQTTVAVAKADITSTIGVTGTVAADPARTVKATANGTVRKVYVDVGETVKASTTLFDIRVPLEPTEETVVTGPDGTVTSTPPRARYKTVTVKAGGAGRLATLTVLPDQEVTVGTDVATVSPGTLSVTAPLTQTQQFRLLKPPASASAQAAGGPAPFDCVDLRTGAAEPGSDTDEIDPMTGMPVEASTAQVSCRVPAGTTVFAGMSVDLTVQTGAVEGALTVPVSAVLGTVEAGKVWIMGKDGEPAERAVSLGVTDGEVVQITKGLAEGDEVLEFTPVSLDDEVLPDEEMFG